VTSRLLPTWLPIHDCGERTGSGACPQPNAFDSADGLAENEQLSGKPTCTTTSVAPSMSQSDVGSNCGASQRQGDEVVQLRIDSSNAAPTDVELPPVSLVDVVEADSLTFDTGSIGNTDVTPLGAGGSKLIGVSESPLTDSLGVVAGVPPVVGPGFIAATDLAPRVEPIGPEEVGTKLASGLDCSTARAELLSWTDSGFSFPARGGQLDAQTREATLDGSEREVQDVGHISNVSSHPVARDDLLVAVKHATSLREGTDKEQTESAPERTLTNGYWDDYWSVPRRGLVPECSRGRCDQQAEAGRKLCYYDGKRADGLIAEVDADSRRTPRTVKFYAAKDEGPRRPVGMPPKHPYATWFDGQPHTLTAGVDFGTENTCGGSVQSTRKLIIEAAKRRGYAVTIRQQQLTLVLTPIAEAVA
jgi:hypothetical protein